jgi:hypothetical protein
MTNLNWDIDSQDNFKRSDDKQLKGRTAVTSAPAMTDEEFTSEVKKRKSITPSQSKGENDGDDEKYDNDYNDGRSMKRKGHSDSNGNYI